VQAAVGWTKRIDACVHRSPPPIGQSRPEGRGYAWRPGKCCRAQNKWLNPGNQAPARQWPHGPHRRGPGGGAGPAAVAGRGRRHRDPHPPPIQPGDRRPQVTPDPLRAPRVAIRKQAPMQARQHPIEGACAGAAPGV
jgi:hypothetical protein